MKVLLILYLPSPTLCLAKFLFWSYCLKCSLPIRLHDSLKCKISRKKWVIKLIFCLLINIRVSYMMLLIAYGVRGQVCPKYQKWQVSNIFVIVQKRGEGKICFLHEDEHQSFLQADNPSAINMLNESQKLLKFAEQHFYPTFLSFWAKLS